MAVDCDEPALLADFYSAMSGWAIAFSSDDFVALSGPGIWLTVHRVDDYRRPSWPEAEVPKQLHLDFAAADLDDAEAKAIALGATKAAVQPEPKKWRVLLDPAGHPFCLSSLIPPE